MKLPPARLISFLATLALMAGLVPAPVAAPLVLAAAGSFGSFALTLDEVGAT